MPHFGHESGKLGHYRRPTRVAELTSVERRSAPDNVGQEGF
jgi:hypothetical protein